MVTPPKPTQKKRDIANERKYNEIRLSVFEGHAYWPGQCDTRSQYRHIHGVAGIYDQLIEAVSNLFTNKEKRRDCVLFLLPLGIGTAVATLAFAQLATIVLERYPVPAQFFFIGLVMGNVPGVVKMHRDTKPSIRRLIALVCGLMLAAAIGIAQKSGELGSTFVNPSSSGLLYFGAVGFFAGGAVVTPCLSGSYIFLLAGTYGEIMQALASLTQPPIHWGVITSMTMGIGAGILICSKLIHIALKRQPALTFYAILGLICGSFVGLWPAELDASVTSLAGILTFAAGAVIAYLFGRRAGDRSATSHAAGKGAE